MHLLKLPEGSHCSPSNLKSAWQVCDNKFILCAAKPSLAWDQGTVVAGKRLQASNTALSSFTLAEM